MCERVPEYHQKNKIWQYFIVKKRNYHQVVLGNIIRIDQHLTTLRILQYHHSSTLKPLLYHPRTTLDHKNTTEPLKHHSTISTTLGPL